MFRRIQRSGRCVYPQIGFGLKLLARQLGVEILRGQFDFKEELMRGPLGVGHLEERICFRGGLSGGLALGGPGLDLLRLKLFFYGIGAMAF